MAGLSSFVALVVGVTLWVVVSDEPYVAPTPGRAEAVRAADAAAVVQHLASALGEGAPQAAARLGADPEVSERLAALVENARAIPLTDVTLRYVDELGAVDASGEWSATVAATWQVSGADEQPLRADVRFDFTTEAGRVVVTGVGGAGGVTPVWTTGPLDVRREGDVVVMAAARAGEYASLALRAVTEVRRVLPGWEGPLVVEVPQRGVDVDAALDVEPGTFRNVAGVTAAADGSGSGSTPVHVFLNPAQMRRLRPAGAQVVVSHEAVHVAVDAPASSLPVWLSEGFADYVALRDVDLPLSTTAAQVIDQVRRRGVPRTLPGDDDFDEQSERFGAAYEAAWLACRLLADQEGEPTLLRLHRRAEGAANFERVFKRTIGESAQEFTDEWRELLRDLAA